MQTSKIRVGTAYLSQWSRYARSEKVTPIAGPDGELQTQPILKRRSSWSRNFDETKQKEIFCRVEFEIHNGTEVRESWVPARTFRRTWEEHQKVQLAEEAADLERAQLDAEWKERWGHINEALRQLGRLVRPGTREDQWIQVRVTPPEAEQLLTRLRPVPSGTDDEGLE